MRTFTYGAALAMLVASPVLAGDLVTPVVEQPVMMAEQAPVSAWTGGYVGGNISYGFGSLDAKDDLASALATNGFGKNLSEPDGVSGALRAGYDWQFGRGLFGLGAEYNFGSYDGDGEGALAGSGVNVEIKDKASISFYVVVGKTTENFVTVNLIFKNLLLSIFKSPLTMPTKTTKKLHQ